MCGGQVSLIVLSVVLFLRMNIVLSQFYLFDSTCSLLPNATRSWGLDTTDHEATCDSDYSSCNYKQYLSMSTEYYSYYGANSTLRISLNTTEESLRYYKLCSGMSNKASYVLIGCFLSNVTHFNASVALNETGLNELTVSVYNESSLNQGSFLDCTTSKVLVADDSGLDLNVTLLQASVEEYIPINPPQVSTVPPTASTVTASGIVPSFPLGLSCPSEPVVTHYQIGNITFTAGINLTNYTRAIFSYSFGDGHTQNDIVNQSNVSMVPHYYMETGMYNYAVHVIAVLPDDELAVHAYKESNITVYERVTQPNISVGSTDPSVALGVSKVKVSIGGSLPVKFCWCIVLPNTTACSKVPIVNSTETKNISCYTVYNSTVQPYTVLMNFTMEGRHHIRANFTNIVNCRNKSFTFSVYSPPSPVVIITVSSATVGILAGLLALVIIIIIVIITVVIPYRRYKYRMTETANFRFVELSDSSTSVKSNVKRRARNLASLFRSSTKSDRVGLVNADATGDDDLGSSERLLNRNNKNVVTFAPYDSL